MNEADFIAKIEAWVGETEGLETADDWVDFTVGIFKAIEKTAAANGFWAEFDAALLDLKGQVNKRVTNGRWPE